MGKMRKVGMLVCCLAFMGLFFSSALPVQADTNVYCEHAQYRIVYDAVRGKLFKPEGHFNEIGTKHVCADCGRVYWTDLYQKKYEDHQWSGWVPVNIDGRDVLESYCTTSGCPHTRQR